MILSYLLVVSGYQYTDGTQVVVSSEDSSYVYTKPVYKSKVSDSKMKNKVVQYLWKQSPLRAMMIGITHRSENQTQGSNSTALSKRSTGEGGNGMGVAMAVGMSGPAMVGMV